VQDLSGAAGDAQEQLIFVLRNASDPSWGVNKGRSPRHPRYVFVGDERKERASEDDSLSVSGRWLEALGRSDSLGVLRDSMHRVQYRKLAAYGELRAGKQWKQIADEHIVISEMVNADWTSLTSVQALRDILLKKGEDLVSSEAVVYFEVLQSDDEPSFFKTFELYSSAERLQDYMKHEDEKYVERIAPYRAAVNRVRQAFKIVQMLM